jgi:Uma2 family endonuclease
MSVAPSDPRAAVVRTDSIWRLTVRQYHEMIRQGILTDDDPVELLQGLLVTKMPKNPPHRIATGLVRDALQALVPSGWCVDSQEPITTGDSEPEPDVAFIRGNTRDYADRHPGPGDVALVVEVADTTLERDRRSKREVYAKTAVPVYWIVDLAHRRVETFTEPVSEGGASEYRKTDDYAPSDDVPVVIGGQQVGSVRADSLLP